MALFAGPEITQPTVTGSLSIAGLFFNATDASGYDITSMGGATLTLSGYNSTGSSGTSNSSAAAIRSNTTSGINTIDVGLILAPAGTPSGYAGPASIFYQAAGGTLVVNGTIFGTNPLSLKGGGTIELNASNSGLSGGVSIDQSGTTVVLGNNVALGTATFSVNNTSTIQANGGARTIGNDIVLGGDTTLSGSNAFTFNGSVTSSGSSTRKLTVSNTGGATLAANVFLAPDNTTARGLTISGTSAVTISGVIANNNSGNSLASSLTYNGSNTLTLSNTNTYTGTTSVSSSGTLLINGNQSSATGAVSVTSTGTLLGGIGTIGGAVSVNAGSNITGATNGTVGALTLSNGLTLTGTSGNLASYIVDLTSSSSDLLSITGNLNLSTAFDQILFQGTTGAASYQLATYTGTLTGTFNTVTNLPSGYSLQYNTGEIDLVMAPVPEPSTWIGGTLAVGVVGWSALKRRNTETLIHLRHNYGAIGKLRRVIG